MSQRWDQVEERLDDYESQLDLVYRLYHIPVLAALMTFMLWVRARHYERYVTDGGILLGGNDAWYHYRTTNYAVRHFPWNLPFDPWTGFDEGQRTGQFGTLFDQLIAFAALVVGLGDPSQSTIDMTFLLAPAVFGALCAVPVFYIGKRLGGKFGGIVAVLVLAMTPGAFLSRSVAGFTDHHVAETLFQAFSLLAAMVMVTVAQREKPIYELIEARDFDALRRPAVWGAIAGVAASLHIWVWPPAVFFLGLFGLFVYVVLSLEYVRGHSPDHLAIPSVVAMLVVVVLTGLKVATLELEATDFSLLQPLLAFAVALGAVFMAGVARLWDDTDLPRVGYPAAVAATGVVLAVLVAVVSPDTFNFFVTQVTRVAGLTATDTARTVGEISSPWSVADGPLDFFSNSYKLAFYTGVAGFGLLVYRNVVAERPRAEQIILVVWSVFVLLMTLTQVRFDYYFVIAVAATNAYLVGEIFRFVDLDDVRRDVTNVKPYQVLIVVAVLFVVAGPLLVTGATVDAADSSANPGESRLWADSLEWMNENTPAPGAYGSGDEPRLDYYGTYPISEDFDYQDGEYGVMAWWDYGHFITTGAQRIPVANPFQQHASDAADFLLAGNESQSLRILDEDNGEGSGVKYVMVDYQLAQMGTGKYTAPAAWETRHDFERVRARSLEKELDASGPISLYPDLATLVYVPKQSGQGYRQGWLDTQRAYESMRVRLYRHHGSAIEASTRVYQFEQYNPEEGWGIVADVKNYNSPEAARQAAANDSNAVQGGGRAPSERVDALQHFRMVYASKAPEGNPQSWVKTFERVEGATIEGTGPPNTEVQTSVEMVSEATGQTFYYNQYAQTDENGNFEMVVPYSTTGYDEYGVEAGYTDVDVRANGSYQFLAVQDGGVAWTGETEVTEGQVLGEDDSPATVELEQAEGAQGGDQENSTDDGTDSTTGGDSGENTTDDGSNDTSGDQQRRAARAP
jgi:dolichyl-diphosphooligosaccharide--protein glycosyltransferase